jgi:hypothetical protein
MKSKEISWATSGYLGAISSGDTTCGLLVGSSIAIGIRYGQGKTCFPLEDGKTRNKAVVEVNELYEDFLEEFKSTQCNALTQCDFSKESEGERYITEEVYEKKCFRFFNFVMDRFIKMEKDIGVTH